MMEQFYSEDFYRNPHLLCLCGKIILFNCKLAQVANDRERSELVFCSFSYERDRNAFVKAAAGSAGVSRKTSAHVHVVKSDCAVDVRTRLATPCVLVTKKSEKRGTHQYTLLTLSSSNRLKPHMEFKLPYQIKEHVYILKGPTVLWSHNYCVFYTSLQAGGVRQVPFELSHCVIAELPLHKGQMFVLGLQKPSEQCPDNNTSQTLGYFIEDGHVFDGSVIVPHPYIGITRCIVVLSSHSVEDGVLRCAAVAATSNQQLVYFENATVKDTCELPYEKPEHIQVVNTGRHGGLYVITFCQGHVCALWKETFKIASCWSGVSSVHVDDFLECGTDQMLLVFTNQSEPTQSLENFLITDLSGISYSCGQAIEAPQPPPSTPENFLLTLRALESRLQSGLTVLQELQQEVRVKERVLRQSVQTLTDVVSGGQTVLTDHRQEGLVALWECDDEPKDEASDDKMQDMPAVSSKPHVDKLWHRITADRMVVGVILTADSSVPVASLSLSVLTETGHNSAPAVIQTHSQVFCLPSSPSPSSASSSSSSSSSVSMFPEPAAKRSRQRRASTPDDLHARRLAVTAVTELTPLLNSSRVKCRVVLHYARRRDAFALASNPTPATVLCGRLDLDIHNDLQTQLLKSPQLDTDDVREDLLSLLTALDRWVFHIDSPDYSLGDINGWIEKRAGCKKIEVNLQYLLFDSPEPSAVMLLHWHQTSPFQGELSIHSSQFQTLKFLDLLLARLPASCSVQPVRGERGGRTAQAFASALERELASLKEGAASLLRGEDDGEGAEGPEGAPETGSEEALHRCREVWQQQVERSKRRLSPLVDVGRYRRLVQSSSGVRLDGDVAALLDIQRTLLG